MTHGNFETPRRAGRRGLRAGLTALLVLAPVLFEAPGLRAEPILSDRELFLKGQQASEALDWTRSLKFLYAYLQRNPVALDEVPGHRLQVEAVLLAAESEIDATFRQRAELEQQVVDVSERSSLAELLDMPQLDFPKGLSDARPRRGSSGLQDEFDQLMVKNFLIEPGRYVRVEHGRLSRSTFITRQKGIFVLPAARRHKGVAILRTNLRVHGKLLFSWGLPGDGRELSLILEAVTLYDKVRDPRSVRRTQRIVVPPSLAVDLDSGRVGSDEAADLRFRSIDGQIMFIEAVNGARLEFPMASLCAWCR